MTRRGFLLGLGAAAACLVLELRPPRVVVRDFSLEEFCRRVTEQVFQGNPLTRRLYGATVDRGVYESLYLSLQPFQRFVPDVVGDRGGLMITGIPVFPSPYPMDPDEIVFLDKELSP